MKRARGGDRGGRLGAEMDSHGDRSSVDDWFANQEKNAKARPLITLREKPKKEHALGCDVCGKLRAGKGAGGIAGPGRGRRPGYAFRWCGSKHHEQLQPQIDAALAASEPTPPRPKSSGTISASSRITWKRMPLSEYERGRAGDPRRRHAVDSHAPRAGDPRRDDVKATKPNRRRASQLLVRVTENERANILLAAGEESHNISHWIRRTLLKAAKKNETEPDLLSRLDLNEDELGELRAAAEWQDLALEVWARALLLQTARKVTSFEGDDE